MLRAFCFVLALIFCNSPWSTAHAASPAREAVKTVRAIGKAAGTTSKTVGHAAWAAAGIEFNLCWWWGKSCPKKPFLLWDPKSDNK
ncbi:hypothetical protein [Bradyrhizobium arachidis]|uniref:hypothetical protein n=1 Tax=Bradyrhizobium arachidis TaxID=858423 RepID=UPI0021619BBF|nr:hypothetical protein [Bradyrhizobium arachidis]UVO26991.1 hypothetical protein KUF59_31270 [Bradyrhizobium arachidis]